jgi:hypothetical protein
VESGIPNIYGYSGQMDTEYMRILGTDGCRILHIQILLTEGYLIYTDTVDSRYRIYTDTVGQMDTEFIWDSVDRWIPNTYGYFGQMDTKYMRMLWTDGYRIYTDTVDIWIMTIYRYCGQMYTEYIRILWTDGY